MRFLALLVVAVMVASCMAASKIEERKAKLSEREILELEEMKKRLETDPEFRREVEAQLEEKLADLSPSERKEAKKRFWGLLGIWNPFLLPFFWGKRDVSKIEDAQEMVDLTEKLVDKKLPEEWESDDELETKKVSAKRFWGLWGLWGWPYFGLWGKKRSMETEEMPAVDTKMMEMREAEFRRFEEAEKRLSPETYKREGEMVTVEEVKEMKKRWWGLGYGYGLGLGYGWGLGYPWGFWGKRDTMTTEKRDEFVDREMMKVNREAAYERLLRDL